MIVENIDILNQNTIDFLNQISYFIGFSASLFVLVSMIGFLNEIPTKLVFALICAVCFATFIGVLTYYFKLNIEPFIRAFPFDIAIVWIAIYTFRNKKKYIAERRNN